MTPIPENPVPAAGYRRGVGIMLLNPAGRVFVGRRIDTQEHAWQMPQGGIDKGEEPARAAFRELEEETGTAKAELVLESRGWFSYDLPPEVAGRMWHGRYRGQTQKWLVLRFTGQDHEIDVATGHPEFDDWRWVEVGDLVSLIVPFKRPLYEAVIAEFEPRLQALGIV